MNEEEISSYDNLLFLSMPRETRQTSDTIEDIYGFDVSEGYIRAEGVIPRRTSRW